MRNAEHIVGPSDLPLLEKDGARARPGVVVVRRGRVLLVVWVVMRIPRNLTAYPRRRCPLCVWWVVVRSPSS